MIDSTSTLEQIQELIREHLAANVALDAASVISRLKGDIETQINEALNRLGFSIVVLPPMPRVARPNLPGPYFDEINIQIHAVEIPTTNTTGLSALEAAESILKTLHHRNLKLSDGTDVLITAAQNAIEPVDDTESVNFVIVNLRTSSGLTCEPRL